MHSFSCSLYVQFLSKPGSGDVRSAVRLLCLPRADGTGEQFFSKGGKKAEKSKIQARRAPGVRAGLQLLMAALPFACKSPPRGTLVGLAQGWRHVYLRAGSPYSTDGCFLAPCAPLLHPGLSLCPPFVVQRVAVLDAEPGNKRSINSLPPPRSSAFLIDTNMFLFYFKQKIRRRKKKKKAANH